MTPSALGKQGIWIAAGANPKEVSTRAGQTSVSFTLDRYGHLFPGSESKLNDSLDAYVGQVREHAAGDPATSAVEVATSPEDAAPLEESQATDTTTIRSLREPFARDTRTASDGDDPVPELQASDQGEQGGP